MNTCIAKLEQLIAEEDWDGAKAEAIKLNYLESINAAARGLEHH